MAATLEKNCENCAAVFQKPRSCGLPEWGRRRFCSPSCKIAAQIGKNTAKLGGKYPTGRARYLPCRICGCDTRYRWSGALAAERLVRCTKPDCIAASRALKNERIADRHKVDYATGKRRKLRDNWTDVSRVSAEERLLAPWFEEIGWSAQFGLTLGVSDVRLPRYLVLDFANPSLKLDVEIDGSVHRLRRERDDRRDAMLNERGWKVLRVDAKYVRSSTDEAIATISSWIASHATN